MKDMTQQQALAEAVKRWGTTGAVRIRPGPVGKRTGGGRLARYRFTVGNGGLGKLCTVQGQGDTWREAFEDARPTNVSPRAAANGNGAQERKRAL